MVTDSYGNFVARSFLFRVEDYIVMSGFRGEKELPKQLYQKDILSQLVSQIFERASDSLDSLERIYLVKDSYGLLDDIYPTVLDESLVSLLPHCDLEGPLYQIGYHEKAKENFQSKVLYERVREKVQIIQEKENINHAVNRMRALYHFMMPSSNEELCLDDFLSVDTTGYTKVYQGQDFLFATDLLDDVFACFLPTDDIRQQEEIEEVFHYIEREKKGPIKIKKYIDS